MPKTDLESNGPHCKNGGCINLNGNTNKTVDSLTDVCYQEDRMDVGCLEFDVLVAIAADVDQFFKTVVSHAGTRSYTSFGIYRFRPYKPLWSKSMN